MFFLKSKFFYIIFWLMENEPEKWQEKVTQQRGGITSKQFYLLTSLFMLCWVGISKTYENNSKAYENGAKTKDEVKGEGYILGAIGGATLAVLSGVFLSRAGRNRDNNMTEEKTSPQR